MFTTNAIPGSYGSPRHYGSPKFHGSDTGFEWDDEFSYYDEGTSCVVSEWNSFNFGMSLSYSKIIYIILLLVYFIVEFITC